ncbi:MAG: phasin family protein [Firmicutes bacterium]|nr:phasin family protein [Bacillota bacterium]
MDRITDLFRKTLLFSIGAVALTAERAQEIVNDLIERGEVSAEQGKAMVGELVKRGTEARKQLRDMVKGEVKKAIEEADIPSKEDIKRLEQKIDKLILEEKQPHVEAHIEHKDTGEVPPEF